MNCELFQFLQNIINLDIIQTNIKDRKVAPSKRIVIYEPKRSKVVLSVNSWNGIEFFIKW